MTKGYHAYMKFKEWLKSKKTSIIDNWFDQAINAYAPDTGIFYKNQKDTFANPVGSTAEKALNELFDALLANDRTESVAGIIDPLIRIRAVQNLSPAKAVEFLFSLKKIVREALPKNINRAYIEDLYLLEQRIDQMALVGFDVYVKCREKIYDLKSNEERNKIYKAFARAGLITEIEADAPDLRFI
jgi:hypothetical protein